MPSSPFEERKIALGVPLVVLAAIAGFVAFWVGGGIGALFGYVFNYDLDTNMSVKTHVGVA